MKNFGQCVVIRWACVRIRWWFDENAGWTLFIYCVLQHLRTFSAWAFFHVWIWTPEEHLTNASLTLYSAAARRVKKKWTPPHGRTKQNHIFFIQWLVGGTKWMVVKKIFEALPWLRLYSNTVSFATLTPFCAHISQGYEWSWSDKRHVSGISDLGRDKYVAVMIINTFLHWKIYFT